MVPDLRVVLTKEVGFLQSYKKRKKYFFIFVVFLLILVLIASGISYQGQIKDLAQKKISFLQDLKIKPTVKPKIIEQGKVSDLLNKKSPKLFYADLEYDPKTGVTTQLKTGLINSEQASLSPSLPKGLTSANFAYKIEVSSPDGKTILQSGWKVTFKKVVETPKKTLRFGVATVYQPNAIVKVYLSGNKLIWTGKIKEKSS